MSEQSHRRSACAQRTEGVTLDHVAPLYDWLAPVMMLGMESGMQRQVIAALDLDAPLAVLDAGCGTGALTRKIFDAMPGGPGRRVVGVDAAEAMIRIAQRKAGNRDGLLFEAALAESLPHHGGCFDRVVSTLFFHHLHYALKVRALDELWRVLRPGGRGVVLDVDIPYTRFGKLCAMGGYWLFQQPEILENIRGRLREALDASAFKGAWRIASRHNGYISLFELQKPTTGKDRAG